MDPGVMLAYFERQVEQEKARLTATRAIDKIKVEEQSDTVILLHRVLDEMDELQAQVRKIAADQRGIRQDIATVKAKVKKAEEMEVDWPITEKEEFQRVEKMIKTHVNYAAGMTSLFSHLKGNRTLIDYFSEQVLDGFSKAGRDHRTALKKSPFMTLIGKAWAQIEKRTLDQIFDKMENELIKLRKSQYQKRFYERKKGWGVPVARDMTRETDFEDVELSQDVLELSQDQLMGNSIEIIDAPAAVLATDAVDVTFPINDIEEFERVELMLKNDPKYAEKVKIYLDHPSIKRKLIQFFSEQVLDKFSLCGRYERRELKTSPLFCLIAEIWAKWEKKTLDEMFIIMDTELKAVRKAVAQRNRKKVKSKSKGGKRDEEDAVNEEEDAVNEKEDEDFNEELKVSWPISEMKDFKRVEQRIKRDPLYAEELKNHFSSPSEPRLLMNHFSEQLISGYGKSNQEGRTPFEKSPLICLIGESWAKLEKKTLDEIFTSMSLELIKHRYSQKRLVEKKRKMEMDVEWDSS